MPESQRTAYTLIPEAFLERDQNLRKSELERLLRGIGIENCWSWIEKHKDIKNFIENVRGGENTAEAELEQWIKYRNEAAHTIVEDNWLGFNELLDLTIFVKAICQSLADLLSYHQVILMARHHKAKMIGEIRRYFDHQKVAKFKAIDGTISTHFKIFLINQEISVCKAIKIDNIRFKVSEDRVEDTRELRIDKEQDIELKLIIADDIKIKKNWQIYVIDN